MEPWLIAIIAVFCCIGIVAFIYIIFAFRRFSIVCKKIDYLVEDITYKSEKLNNVVDVIIKLSGYVDVIEGIIKRNSDVIFKFIKNPNNIQSIDSQLDDTISRIEEGKNDENK